MITRETKKRAFLNSGFKLIKSDRQAYQITRWALKQRVRESHKRIKPAFLVNDARLLLIKPGNLYAFYRLNPSNKKILLICDLSAVEENK